MRCRKVKKLLPDYIGDELPTKERRRIERHLDGCPNCKDALKILEELWRGIAHQPLPPKGEEFWQEFTRNVMMEIRGKHPIPTERKKTLPLPGWRFLIPATTVAALVIIVVAIVLKGLWGPLLLGVRSPLGPLGEQEALVEVISCLSFGPMAWEEESPLGGIKPEELYLLTEQLSSPIKPTETATMAAVLTLLFGQKDLYGELEGLKGDDLEEFYQLLCSRYHFR